ncbi:MAG: DUF2125 domain-containing protein [Proteobacteria bacterium]|nr:DUF2125 domain-containing protein [Pseudomonadota bacterium]
MLQNRKKLRVSLLVGFLSLLLLGSIGWFALFEYSTRWLKTEVERGIADLKQKGYDISYSSLTFQGHPLSIKAIVQRPHLKDPLGVFDWQGQELNISMKPWNWYRIEVALPHDQKIFIPQNTSIPLEILSLEGAHGMLTLTQQGRLDEASFIVDYLRFLTKDTPQPIFLQALSLKAKNLSHPLDLYLSVASDIKGMEAFFNGTPSSQPFVFSLDATLAGFQGKTLPRSYAEWRDGGGVLDVKLLKLMWPPITMTAEGTVTFDKDMYPLGSFSSRIIGYQEALTHLVETGCVKKKNASMVSFVLDMMSRVDGAGSKHLTVPITLQDRKVSVGAIPLWKME